MHTIYHPLMTIIGLKPIAERKTNMLDCISLNIFSSVNPVLRVFSLEPPERPNHLPQRKECKAGCLVSLNESKEIALKSLVWIF